MIYMLGFLLGLVVAACGAWKDTLFEPFSIAKFFRSPVVVELWFLFLLYAYPAYPVPLVLLSSVALERLSVEAYKAVRRQPPGKFKSPTKDRGWLLKRLGIKL